MKAFENGIHAQEVILYGSDGNVIAPASSGATVKPVASDGNPSEFSLAAVGAHAHVATATLATAQTYTKPAGATAMLAQNTGTAGLRYTLDGTAPETALGFQLRKEADPVLIPCPGASVKMIREADGGALDYQWVK